MTTFTTTSPTGAALPAGVTQVGGIVLDIIGLNGVRVVSQLSAGSLFQGFFGTNPGTIGTQEGFTPAVLAALGGGISKLAVRVTISDGDTATGDFDEDANTLQLNGIELGDFSDVTTEITDSTGTTGGSLQSGFPDEELATGWFYSTDPAILSALFASLQSTGKVLFGLNDTRDVGDNFFDFAAGVDGGLVDVGQGPAPAGITIGADDLTPALGACDLGAVLGSDDLSATGAAGATITYTVTAASAGTILINGEMAGTGATFTQQDIDAGRVMLLAGPVAPAAPVNTPSGAISGAGIAFADSFNFTVSDGTSSANGTFTAPYAAFDTVQTSPQYGGYWGGNGNDYQLGTANADNMSGGNGCDLMIGGDGNDQMNGQEGNNRVFGQGGNDNLTGGNGNDLLDGGADNDQLHANGGNNWLFGGDGNDTMTAGSGHDRMFGGMGADLIHANDGNNRINAGAGNDTVTAGSGNDVIIAGAGDDVVHANGGTNKFQLGGITGAVSDGNDQYTGGSGADKYALFLDDRNGGDFGWGNDTINGFRISEGDQLVAFNPQAGFWDNEGALNGLVGSDFITAARGTGNNAGDLTLTFAKGEVNQSSVTLKWFFWDNGSFGTTNGSSAISDTQLVSILTAAVQDGGTVGVSDADFLQKGHNYITRDFMM